ncbi:hypothetical protein QJS04_geneDACA016270 [Acorus gramineus]|uniref:CAP-Gly domain-containing protein n=1 Tax=Acorus gramineus TaxID=55184 RepID=A0AAV9AFS4_ACOGR|nr:hypothetical protein QJS04_geneDACA016270 [Acorus gramineus]
MNESSDESGGFRDDQRVHIAGDPRRIGTVRYVGVVEGHEGMWVGVDWDGDDDGKHDGSVNGVRYFDARTPRSGSLVRPRSLCGGVSVYQAVERRYRGDYTKEEEDEMYVLSTRNNRVSIEFVGKNKVQEKLSRFEDLIGASLAYLGISSAGPPLQINSTIPYLKELDLTGNLLLKWQDIGAVCEQLPDLRVLNVSNNAMRHDIPELPSLGNIRVLVLNNCSITWKEVEVLKESLPKVEELHLMANKLSEITPAPPSSDATYVKGFTSLWLLNLEDNRIHSWDEVLKLSQLRSLEQLHLNKNKLRRIFYPAYHPRPASEDDFNSQDQRIGPFEKLHCLLLGCNEIEDLASVDSLNSFPSLRDIRLSENPVVDPENGGIPRFVQIARLAKAQILNGSEISPRERKESEIRVRPSCY